MLLVFAVPSWYSQSVLQYVISRNGGVAYAGVTMPSVNQSVRVKVAGLLRYDVSLLAGYDILNRETNQLTPPFC